MTFDWLREWDAEFQKRIAQEAVRSDIPASRWIASGKRTKGFPNGEDRKFWNIYGPGWAKNWGEFRSAQTDWNLWHTPDGLPGIETPLPFMAGGVEVKAIPDRIYETPEGLAIVDLKSGSRKPDAGYQLDIYRLALDVRYGIPGDGVIGLYYMNRKGELLSNYSPVKYNRALLEEMFATAMAQIDAGHFLPNPGNQCSRCSVAKHCEMVGGKLP